MTISLVLLLLVIFIALAFDFTNGFHDTGNAMATSIATGALKPKTAVGISAVLNFVGAFLSIEVALTVTNSVIKIQDKKGLPKAEFLNDNGYDLLMILLAGLIGAILWNLITWLFSIPSSSSHALFGGLIGAAIGGVGFHNVNWLEESHHNIGGVVGKVILPAIVSPAIALVIAAINIILIYKLTNKVSDSSRGKSFRYGQIITASLVSLAHGTNDAQKTMGIITLALIGYGTTTNTTSIPLWVKIACASAIALGTYIGGWRIIKTLGKGVVELSAPQGMTAEITSATIILLSTHMGAALSTTHVTSGSIIGVGLGKKNAEINWKLVGKMFLTWMITLPLSIIMGYVMWEIGHLNKTIGPFIIVSLLIILSGYMYYKSRKNNISANNVNDNETVQAGKKATGVAINEPHITVVTGKKKKQHSYISRKKKTGSQKIVDENDFSTVSIENTNKIGDNNGH